MAILHEDAGDAPSNPHTTPYNISPGDTFIGRLREEEGVSGWFRENYDWIRIPLVEGHTYEFRLRSSDDFAGTWYSSGTLLRAYDSRLSGSGDTNIGIKLDITVKISDTVFQILEVSYATEEHTRFTFKVPSTDTYFLGISGDLPGSYELLVQDTAAPSDPVAPEPAVVPDPVDAASPVFATAYEIAETLINSDHPYTFPLDPDGTLTLSFDVTGVTHAGQQLARQALEVWSTVSGIEFVESQSETANLVFHDDGSRAHVYYWFLERPLLSSVDIYVPEEWVNRLGDTIGTHSFYLYLHEIGHALGLGHPGDYDGDTTFSEAAWFLNDSFQMTVMSYFSQSDNPYTWEYNPHLDADHAYPITPMRADIIAVQKLYDIPVHHNAGNTRYGYDAHWSFASLTEALAGGRPTTLTIHDPGGYDWLDLSTDTTDQIINLEPGGISDVYGVKGNLVIADNTFIESFATGKGDNHVTGNIADNLIQSWAGDDVLLGKQGNDVLIDNLGGDDRLLGGAGDDMLEGGPGADVLDGGPGMDAANYHGSNARVDVRLGSNLAQGGEAEGDTLISIENLIGSQHSDTLAGDWRANYIDGGSGDDLVWGSGGNDILEGGHGADRLVGGSGLDTAKFADSNAGVTVNLSASALAGGHAEGDTFARMTDVSWKDEHGVTHTVSLPDIENLTGSEYADNLTGDVRANVLSGSYDDDVLAGLAGSDQLIGGDGLDTADYSASNTGVIVRLHSHSALGGHAQGDNFARSVAIQYGAADGSLWIELLPDIENLTGSGYADILAGDRRENVLSGGPGNDTLYGGPGGGDDLMLGGAGNDKIYGGQGDDTLIGGPGNDKMIGGQGADLFVFEPGENEEDIITDFGRGNDRIDLRAFNLEGIEDVSLFSASNGINLDLGDVGGGTILLANVTTPPDMDDFLV